MAVDLIARAMASKRGVQDTILDGKQIVFLGDSYCTGLGWSTEEGTEEKRGYSYGIQKNNPLSECVNLAVNGAGITNVQGDLSIHLQMYKQASEYPKCDYIIIEGGINDALLDKPIGVITDNFNNNELDISSVCGSLEMLFSSIFYDFETTNKIKKIGFITSTIVKKTKKLSEITEATIKVCKKWSIPVLDLYNSSGYAIDSYPLYNKFMEHSTEHPNKLSYEICFIPKIEKWIKKL